MDNPITSQSSSAGLTRSSDNRVLAGLAGGLGRRTGIEPDLIRAGFVVLTFAGGVGAVMYVVGWMLASNEPEAAPTGGELAFHQKVATGVMFLGALLLLRGVGLWFGDRVVWPVALVSFGVAALTARRFGEDRDWLARITQESGRGSQGRVTAGAVLLVGGVTILLGSIDAIQQAGIVALAVAVTALGLFLVLGPWLFRLADDLARERRDRIRAGERADVAAHLHDSVLQTLSLIQRTDDPRRMATLARAQERELRAWLYDTEGEAGMLHAALREHASRIEQEYNVPIEVVTVGADTAIDERTSALASAAAEAMTNAAKHSGADRVSVFVECASDQIDVFVSDQGAGFDPASVSGDRRGISASIVGRMERHGGSAEVSSEAGRGTEIHLWVTP